MDGLVQIEMSRFHGVVHSLIKDIPGNNRGSRLQITGWRKRERSRVV